MDQTLYSPNMRNISDIGDPTISIQPQWRSMLKWRMSFALRQVIPEHLSNLCDMIISDVQVGVL